MFRDFCLAFALWMSVVVARPVEAIGPMFLHQLTSGCATPTTGDTMNEGFLGTGYEKGACGVAPCWTEAGTGTIDEDHTLVGSPPAGSCTEGLRVSDSAANSRTTYNHGSTIARSSDLDIVCSVYVNAVTLNNNEASDIIAWDVDSGPGGSDNVGTIEIFNNSGTYQFRANATGSSSTGISFSLSTWYTIKLHQNGAVPGNSYINIGASTYNFTRLDTADGQYLQLGGLQGVGAGESFDIEFGYCYINTP